jgi:hypothetical protein
MHPMQYCEENTVRRVDSGASPAFAATLDSRAVAGQYVERAAEEEIALHITSAERRLAVRLAARKAAWIAAATRQ